MYSFSIQMRIGKNREKNFRRKTEDLTKKKVFVILPNLDMPMLFFDGVLALIFFISISRPTTNFDADGC